MKTSLCIKTQLSVAFWEGEAPAEPYAGADFKLGGSLALPV